MFQGITELSGTMERHSGGHNFPDMEFVVDRDEVTIENGSIYLIQINGREPVAKKCRDQGGSIRIGPAVSWNRDRTYVELFGRKVMCQSIEFSDVISKRVVSVIGKVVGLWAGETT